MKTKQELQIESLVNQLKAKALEASILDKEISAIKSDLIKLRADGFKVSDKPFLVKKTSSNINYPKLVEHYSISNTILNRYKRISYDYKKLVEDRSLEILPEFKSESITYAFYIK
jgi:hypothetical protein